MFDPLGEKNKTILKSTDLLGILLRDVLPQHHALHARGLTPGALCLAGLAPGVIVLVGRARRVWVKLETMSGLEKCFVYHFELVELDVHECHHQ